MADKFVTLDNLKRFKKNLDGEIDEKFVDNLTFNDQVPAGTTPTHLSIIRSGKKYYRLDDSVIANEYLSGDETKLTSITIGDYTYKVDDITVNPVLPLGATVTKLSLLRDGDKYYAFDQSTHRVIDGGVSNFIFKDEAEITYKDTINTNVNLQIPADISQGFISLLTLSNMTQNKTITILSDSPLNTRIVSGTTAIGGNTYVTSLTGKKIIFVRCDGVDVEILIIEELES